MTQTKTVAAVSTPQGKGGIAVIRISGEDALAVADRCFSPACGRPISAFEGGCAVYGRFYEGEENIDDGVATVFRSPHSYTGEDVVELSCHGGVLNTRRVLGAVLAAGAEPAAAGEFTRRAFLAGKLSLTAAEAVADLIDARTEGMRRLSRRTADGKLSAAIGARYDTLVALTASVYAIIDYPEEDLSDVTPSELAARLEGEREMLAALLATYRTGRAISEGVETTVCGRPNVGKSAIYNRLLGEERAIVTDTAGTTRDLLFAGATVGDVLLNLCDTAGLRETEDSIERAGVERARRRAEESELLLAVFDGSVPLTPEDRAFAERVASGGVSAIALLNKSDLPATFPEDAAFLEGKFTTMLRVSAVTGAGFDRLTAAVAALDDCGELEKSETPVVYNARQYAALKKAEAAIVRAQEALSAGFAPDVASVDIELALGALGECDGRAVGEDIVRNIFSRFCVGK